MLQLHRVIETKFIKFMALFLMISFADHVSAEPVQERLIVDITNAMIVITPEKDSIAFTVFIPGQNRGPFLIGLKNFEFKQVSQNIYHLRNKAWKDFFWKIDALKRAVFRVRNGSFGVEGGAEAPLDNVLADFYIAPPDGSEQRLLLGIRLDFKHALLEFDSSTSDSRFSVEDDEITAEGEWNVQRVGRRVYHVQYRRSAEPHRFYKIDAKKMKAYLVTSGSFGSLSGGETSLPWKVQTAMLEPAIQKPGISEDIQMTGSTGEYARSDWFESEKKWYHDLMKNDSYDVLVVPFQVQEYAIDRIGRSLMTRYLAHRIETTTELKVPSPTLVSRAMGELSRRFKDEEVYQLANDLGVKMLIRGYVGHGRDEKLKLTVVVQSRDSHGKLASTTQALEFEWNDIPFTDERLPSEAFLDLLDDVMAKLPLAQTKKSSIKVYKKEKEITVPDSLPDLVGKPPRSPVQSAYYLQLLGALYPENGQAREYLYERSLVALSDISPKSADYALLKARAYYYLHRRPAALAALKAASRPEEKAMQALLEGDLVRLKERIAVIKEPLPRLLAQIELIDLMWSFDKQVVDRAIYSVISRNIPAWKDIIQRRLDSNDSWQVQSNYSIKSMLDELLPVANYTVKDIAMNRMVLGQMNDENDETELSVYTHSRKVLQDQRSLFMENESGQPVKRDILDLLSAIGESNLFQKLRFRIYTQGLPEDGLALLDRYDPIYRGHPLVETFRSGALFRLAASKKGPVSDNLRKQAVETANKACFWYQGQMSTFMAYPHCDNAEFYDGDYPRRSIWNRLFGSTSPGDRDVEGYVFSAKNTFSEVSEPLVSTLKNLDVALRYTHSDFTTFKSYHGMLLEKGLAKEADALEADNQHRFIGNPARSLYFANLKEKKGDLEGAQKLYTEAISSSPDVWSPYEELGALYIRQGELKKAASLYMRYPGFKEGADHSAPDASFNTVGLSHWAFRAAQRLSWHGAIEESVPLYRISAGYQTGSGSSMMSEILLSQMDGNYLQATQICREMATRYNSPVDYGRYTALLHALGYHQEAWSLFNSRNMINDLDDVQRSLFVGHRTEGKTEEEQREWLVRQDLSKTNFVDLQNYVLFSHLTDRFPDDRLADIVSEIDRKTIAARKMDQSKPDLRPQEWETKTRSSKKVRSWAAWFADAYGNLRKKNYAIAYSVFAGVTDAETCNNFRCQNRSFVLPYSAWSAFKSNNVEEIESYLKEYKEKFGETFDYHLALALLNGGRRNHKEAIVHLQAAQFNIKDDSYRPLLTWYQLIEICEWLYEDSGFTEYRDIVLKYARICQALRPLYGWPYAVEAKYTSSEPDRVRALALTLYLDRRSERISKFTEEEKKKALQWLEMNNPFEQTSVKGGKVEKMKI